MPRLIDTEILLKQLDWLEEYDYIVFDAVKRTVDEVPTVDAEPVRHGHWINHFDDLFPEESTQECSICHAEQMGTMLNDNYCPNCGAKMSEVEDGNNDRN